MKVVITFCLLALVFTSARADIVYVPGDTSSIQGGISLAENGDTVLVAEGTYYENVTIQSKAITLASCFLMDGDTSHISKTIINGSQPVNTDNASVVTFLNSPENSVLCGFTITGGYGNKAVFLDIIARGGGGVIVLGSSAVILNNHIINNAIDNITVPDFYHNAQGGGILFDAKGVSGLNLNFSQNLIAGNEIQSLQTGGGAIAISNYIVGGELDYLIEDNIIENNTVINTDPWKAMGGGIFLDFALPTIGNQTIRNNIIRNNNVQCPHSFGGGLYFIIRDTNRHGTPDPNPGPYVYNNIICGNHSDYLGGGVSVWRAYYVFPNGAIPLLSAGNYVPKPSFINNTIVNNTAQDGSGFFIMNHVPFLMNNILWNVYPVSAEWGEIFLGDEPEWLLNCEPNTYGGAEIYYTDIQGGWDGGVGNRESVPQFQDADNGDFCLLEGSPGIGWGMDSIIVPKSDFYGNIRPNSIDEFVDMGAIESPWEQTPPIAISDPNNQIPFKFALLQNYPNPFNPKTAISYQLPVISQVDLSIYNILGQKVASLVSDKQPAGTYKVEWDATVFASGVYLCRLQTDKGFVQSRKLILLK